MKYNCSLITVVVLIVLAAAISVSAGTIFYNINIQYDAKNAVIPEYLKADAKTAAIIAVAEFNDMRQVDDKNTIGQVRERDETRVSIFPKDVKPSMAVANGIKEYLKNAGYKVDDKLVQWDLKEATIPKGKSKVIIGGSIEALEITCWRGVFSHNYKASVKLKFVLADSAKGKILYTGKVESASSRDDVSFSEEEIGSQLSTALGDAIQKVFEDKAVAEKIKEAIGQ
jgi:hypothetical protein